MKIQSSVVRFLQSRFANYFVLFFITVSIASIILGSFSELSPYRGWLFAVTHLSSFVFLIEYAARLYTAPAFRPGLNPHRARLRYIFSFYGFVDFVAVLPCILSYVYWGTSVMHIIILPYIFIIFKLIRHSKSFRLIGEALMLVRGELYTAYTACFIIICFSAILMYFIERGAQPEAFNNIGDGLWWAVVTFTTTGYGDIYPITPLGKLLGSIISLIGIAMIAIPTAIIGSSFINIVQQRQAARKCPENRPGENKKDNQA